VVAVLEVRDVRDIAKNLYLIFTSSVEGKSKSISSNNEINEIETKIRKPDTYRF